MNARRSGRMPELSGLELERLLEAVRVARLEVIRAEAEVKIGSPHAEALENFRQSINDLAEALTGNRELFWNKPHSIGMK